ncbi:MAG: hypothetical protein SV775_03570 [Thermodesulfobacteriota bacterium]|nr:hypothetical protein [Thermodesulfobacteriota bacterium]
MARNFKIYVHRNSENVHLKLVGDFDGSSAHELLNSLKRNCCRAGMTFVHTNCLKQIHPFGRDVFRNNFGILKGMSNAVLFTGEDAPQLVPENNKSCRVI